MPGVRRVAVALLQESAEVRWPARAVDGRAGQLPGPPGRAGCAPVRQAPTQQPLASRPPQGDSRGTPLPDPAAQTRGQGALGERGAVKVRITPSRCPTLEDLKARRVHLGPLQVEYDAAKASVKQMLDAIEDAGFDATLVSEAPLGGANGAKAAAASSKVLDPQQQLRTVIAAFTLGVAPTSVWGAHVLCRRRRTSARFTWTT